MSVSAETIVSRILTENPINLDQARRELAPILGKRVDKTTLYRWCLRGVAGVKLEHVRVGNQILVSMPALTRFIEARTAKAISA